jgi:hypothetical protein
MKFKLIVLSPPHHAVVDDWLSFQNGNCVNANAVLDFVVRVK